MIFLLLNRFSRLYLHHRKKKEHDFPATFLSTLRLLTAIEQREQKNKSFLLLFCVKIPCLRKNRTKEQRFPAIELSQMSLITMFP